MSVQAMAVSRSAAVSTACAPRQSVASGATRLNRTQWVQACAARLRQLRPADDRASIGSLARNLCRDVASFDPDIAAEMEHEAWHCDD